MLILKKKSRLQVNISTKSYINLFFLLNIVNLISTKVNESKRFFFWTDYKNNELKSMNKTNFNKSWNSFVFSNITKLELLFR